MNTKSPSPESQPSDSEHHHYWPDGLIPITPQARRRGYVMDVYVTPYVWKHLCTWSGHTKASNTDKRVVELLDSCYTGIARKLATSNDMVAFPFKHWVKLAAKPNARKRAVARLHGRLLLHPESEEPWLLIFHPQFDTKDDLKIGDTPSDGTDTDIELQQTEDI